LAGCGRLKSVIDQGDFDFTSAQGRAVSLGGTPRKYVEADSAHLSAVHKHTMTLALVRAS
jgi:hypothetical protein